MKKFFEIDLRVLSIFRIGLAILIIVDLFFRGIHLEELYTNKGLFTRQDAMKFSSNTLYYSFHLANDSFEFQTFLFLTAAIFAVLLLIGYKTRLATIVSWILITSLHVRNPLILDGGDYLLRLCLMWCMFLPIGEFYSYDSKQKTENPPLKISSYASAGLLIQIAIMYIFTGLTKFRNEEWINGDGIFLSLSEIQFATPIGLYITTLPDYVLRIITKTLIYFEILGPLFLFSKSGLIRSCILLCFTLLHIVFSLCLDIGLFALIDIVCLIPFLSGEMLEKIFLRLKISAPNNYSTGYFLSNKYANIFSLIMIVYIFFSNIDGLYMKKYIPPKLNWFGEIMHIHQSWYMFSTPGTKGQWYNLWYVIPGNLNNGSEVDLFKNGEPVTFEKPKIASYYFKDRHLKKFLVTTGKSYWAYIPSYGKYLCYSWNKTHDKAEHVKSLDIYLMHEVLLSNKQNAGINKHFYWRQYCE